MPTLDTQAVAILPELLLCGGIVLLLAVRLLRAAARAHLGPVALLVALVALAITAGQWVGWEGLPSPDPPFGSPQVLFGGMVVFDHLALFLRGLVLAVTALVIGLTLVTGTPGREDSAVFYALLLGAALGLCLMGEANHLLLVFLGVEMASLPAYALVGFRRGERRAGEAALKYAVYGGTTSAVLLYGISLLAGRLGTGSLPDVASGFAAALAPPGAAGPDPVLLLGAVFVFAGVGAKLAAVPFHVWAPDVLEGAPAEVAGFLAVASVGAAAVLLGRVALLFAGADPPAGPAPPGAAGVARLLVPTLAAFAALTATFGNLAALRQTRLRRLLAWSVVAQSGYLLAGLATLTGDGLAAVLFTLGGLSVLNLGAFAVVGFLQAETGSDDLADCRGLVRRSPRMVLLLALFLLGLAGVPPLAGFAARLQLFGALADAARSWGHAGGPGVAAALLALLAVAALNTVLGAVVYLKVLKVMVLDVRAEDLEGADPVPYRERPAALLYAGLLAAAAVGLGVASGPLAGAARTAAARFGGPPGVSQPEARP